jgi:hypothetical protein
LAAYFLLFPARMSLGLATISIGLLWRPGT